MYDCRRFFIDGQWVVPPGRAELPVTNPATEAVVGSILLGTAEDVDRATQAARRAFESFSQTSREERIALLERIIEVYAKYIPRIAAAVSAEMGAPIELATQAHAGNGVRHFMIARDLLADFEFEEKLNTTQVRREPIGVCGLITPWNWPMNQMCCKIAPALATGCAIVLKPSELSPLSAHVLAEILAEAEVPAGVFNLVDGDGPTVGEAISRHPDIDMVSFTGSTRAGVLVAKAAADTVKRVSQELGGKSANI
ncbi:MAG TPA: aldehyde dehydrogenase family protein, partial [Steroidobacteraceae bacterium]|nr:aldehyde dehydrogenase family protein [Steroidobacteraceae bacterium]